MTKSKQSVKELALWEQFSPFDFIGLHGNHGGVSKMELNATL